MPPLYTHLSSMLHPSRRSVISGLEGEHCSEVLQCTHDVCSEFAVQSVSVESTEDFEGHRNGNIATALAREGSL
jgi:hypothetical protein